MCTSLTHGAHAARREAEIRDARFCEDLNLCPACHATKDELRAARRDALIHSVVFSRPRHD